MPPVFVLVFWLVAAAVFGVLWVGSILLWVASWFQKRRWLKWVAAIPVSVMTLGGLFVAGSVVYGIFQSTRPAYVFKQAFDVPPPADVKELQSKYWFFGDAGSIHLKFKCPKSTFLELKEKLMGDAASAQTEKLLDTAQNGSAPEWWSPASQELWMVFAVERSRPGSGKYFSSETEILAYSHTSQTAYYYFSGVD